jgi:hypothetical protein
MTGVPLGSAIAYRCDIEFSLRGCLDISGAGQEPEGVPLAVGSLSRNLGEWTYLAERVVNINVHIDSDYNRLNAAGLL